MLVGLLVAPASVFRNVGSTRLVLRRVIRDTVPIAGCNVVPVALVQLAILGVAPRMAPRVKVAAEFDKVLDELANLIIVHTEDFAVLAGTKTTVWADVDKLGEDGSHHEDVGGAGDDVCELDVELLVVVSDPAA